MNIPNFDLFGEAIAEEINIAKTTKKTMPRGYAAQPGTGPKGMKCRNCAFYVIKRTQAGYTKPKCELNRHRWTNGRGSDIKVSSDACSKFKPATATN